MTKTPDYRGYRFPREVIARAVWLYHQFTLSFRDVEDLLAERGIPVSYETIRSGADDLDPIMPIRSRSGWGRGVIDGFSTKS